MPSLGLPATIDEAAEVVIARMSSADQVAMRATLREALPQFHRGLGMWIRNTLLAVGNRALVADCARVLEAARKERIARNPVLASVDARFAELRPVIGKDDCSQLIIERVCEALQTRKVD